MSSRARRLADGAETQRFEWPVAPAPASRRTPQAAANASPPVDLASEQARIAAIEQGAFAKGYAQGEQAGLEAAATRGEAMLRRLADTLQELATLRSEMIHRTERQIVQLALAIAERIIHREISLDRGLLVGMARVAIDRLGEQASAVVRLHPDDYAIVSRDETWKRGPIEVVADARVNRGGCLVQSDFGFMDVDVTEQFRELARVLLDDVPAGAAESTVAVNAAVER